MMNKEQLEILTYSNSVTVVSGRFDSQDMNRTLVLNHNKPVYLKWIHYFGTIETDAGVIMDLNCNNGSHIRTAARLDMIFNDSTSLNNLIRVVQPNGFIKEGSVRIKVGAERKIPVGIVVPAGGTINFTNHVAGYGSAFGNGDDIYIWSNLVFCWETLIDSQG